MAHYSTAKLYKQIDYFGSLTEQKPQLLLTAEGYFTLLKIKIENFKLKVLRKETWPQEKCSVILVDQNCC